jgi:hypothetical protein
MGESPCLHFVSRRSCFLAPHYPHSKTLENMIEKTETTISAVHFSKTLCNYCFGSFEKLEQADILDLTMSLNIIVGADLNKSEIAIINKGIVKTEKE